MKKLSIHADDPLNAHDDAHGATLLAGLSLIFLALQSGRPCGNPPAGLEKALTGESFERLKRETEGATRMSAGIEYLRIGPWADIRICEHHRCVRQMSICFDVEARLFRITAGCP